MHFYRYAYFVLVCTTKTSDYLATLYCCAVHFSLRNTLALVHAFCVKFYRKIF